MKRSQRQGFTLVEVTIAMAILVLALSILVENQGFAALMTRDAEKIRIGIMLAEEKLIEAQLHLEEEGWKATDIEEDGDFTDLGSEEFRDNGLNLDLGDSLEKFKWAYTIRTIEMSLPTDVGGMMGDMNGAGYYGDQSENEQMQDNQMDLGDIGVSQDMITDYLSDYIREVRVMVWWSEDYEESGDVVEITTHVVNPSGVVSQQEEEDLE